MPVLPDLAKCDGISPPARHAPFFVMAHHRSGSNFLTDLLQQHRHIECLNEPLSMHTRFFREHDMELWHAEDFHPEALHPSLVAEPAMRQFLFDMRQYLMQSRRERVIGFKDTCLFGKLGWLKAFMPRLKVIFLRRDPRAIVSSVLRCKLAKFWSYAELVPPAYARLFPHYTSRIAPDDTALRATETAAMSVAVRYEMARRTMRLFDHFILQLEDLMHQPSQCIAALAEFLGVESDPAQVAFITEREQESRGGPFSSFRDIEDVEDSWRGHLSLQQLEVIEAVMDGQHPRPPDAVSTEDSPI
jgi:hypothetical protein